MIISRNVLRPVLLQFSHQVAKSLACTEQTNPRHAEVGLCLAMPLKRMTFYTLNFTLFSSFFCLFGELCFGLFLDFLDVAPWNLFSSNLLPHVGEEKWRNARSQDWMNWNRSLAPIGDPRHNHFATTIGEGNTLAEWFALHAASLLVPVQLRISWWQPPHQSQAQGALMYLDTSNCFIERITNDQPPGRPTSHWATAWTPSSTGRTCDILEFDTLKIWKHPENGTSPNHGHIHSWHWIIIIVQAAKSNHFTIQPSELFNMLKLTPPSLLGMASVIAFNVWVAWIVVPSPGSPHTQKRNNTLGWIRTCAMPQPERLVFWVSGISASDVARKACTEFAGFDGAEHVLHVANSTTVQWLSLASSACSIFSCTWPSFGWWIGASKDQ